MDQDDWRWEQMHVTPSRMPASSREEQRLDTYTPRHETQAKLLEVAKAFAADKVQPPLLLIVGPPGVGKTHIAWALAWEYVEDWRQAYYYQAEELLDELRGSFGSGGVYDRRIDRIKKAALLVIDDLGANSETDFGTSKLDMLMDYRYRERLPTVVTANTLEISDRILDRFREGVIVGVKGDSYRKEKRSAKPKEEPA